jgi:hypothetical protein
MPAADQSAATLDDFWNLLVKAEAPCSLDKLSLVLFTVLRTQIQLVDGLKIKSESG